MVVTFGIEDFDKEEYIDNLKKKLDGKDMVLLRHSNLPSPLNKVNMQPALVFRRVNVVVNKTASYFKNANNYVLLCRYLSLTGEKFYNICSEST